MNDATHLHRQVHPSWMQDGKPTVQAFRPFPKDEGHLSVYDGDKVNPAASYAHFNQVLGFKSVGVLTIIHQECTALNLPVESSPRDNHPAHAHIDYSGCQKKEISLKSKNLWKSSSERGWTYQPED